MNVNYKKTLKFVTLSITALLIATVSATTYKYLYIDGSVAIGSQELLWVKDGSTVSGDTVTMDVTVEPGISTNITNRLYLWNNDTDPHNLTLTVTTNVAAATFDLCKIHIYKNVSGWEYVYTLDVTVLNDQYSTYTGNTPLVTDGYYRLNFEIKAKTGTSGTHDFDIELQYE
jgi:hypothetical protein